MTESVSASALKVVSKWYQSMSHASVAHYYDHRNQFCMMKPRTLTIIKGILFSIIMGFVVTVSIVENSGQMTVIAFIIAVLLVFGIEVNEIRVGNWLMINFTNHDDDDDGMGKS